MEPLRRRRSGNVSSIVVTIGLGLLLRNIYLILRRRAPGPTTSSRRRRPSTSDRSTLRPRTTSSMLIAVVVLAGYGLLLQRTRLGTAIRAVADERDLAAASGIDVPRVIRRVGRRRGRSPRSAACCSAFADVQWNMGFRVVDDVRGGRARRLGSAFGAGRRPRRRRRVRGQHLLDRLEVSIAVVLVILILVLLVRPQGIFGVRSGSGRRPTGLVGDLEDPRERRSAWSRRRTRSPPSASTSSSATPGCSNFGQAGFLLVGAYGTAIAVDKWALPALARRSSSAMLRRGARPAARASRRCGCAPTTWRS